MVAEQADDDKHGGEALAMRNERGVQFLVGSSFYREESAVGRDLACLAAAVYKKENGRLHVLDALSGSGIRAARYLAHCEADFVWANDACDNLDPLIAQNLSLASTSVASESVQPSPYGTICGPVNNACQCKHVCNFNCIRRTYET